MDDDSTDAAILHNTLAIACPGFCLGSVGTLSGSNNVGFEFDDYALGVAPTSEVITDYFIGADDFHLAPGARRAAEVVDLCVDLSSDPNLSFTRDLDGALRTIPVGHRRGRTLRNTSIDPTAIRLHSACVL